jgi:hypothetical protein
MAQVFIITCTSAQTPLSNIADPFHLNPVMSYGHCIAASLQKIEAGSEASHLKECILIQDLGVLLTVLRDHQGTCGINSHNCGRSHGHHHHPVLGLMAPIITSASATFTAT